MKKRKIIIISVAILGLVGLSALFIGFYNDDRLVAKEKLPVGIVNFIETNFTGKSIRYAEIDFLDYTVWLEDDTEIEFDWKRNWDKIKRNNLPVPSQLLPSGIFMYIGEKHPESIVTKVSMDDGRYEVYISDYHYELLFSKSGDYIGIDD
ncbi:MAG: PepSY-like domain-containing protein [Tannerella sp.]|jgi:hypothetical protein|nr:PepSY-like domain-containing protein [Tannerella sp.]